MKQVFNALATEKGLAQIEEKLRESEREKNLILNSCSELIAYLDTDFKVMWANKAAAESVNKKIKDLIGHKCYQIWQGFEEPCKGCPVKKAIETGRLQENEMQTPDKKVWQVLGNPVKNKDGNIIGAVEVTLDITEHKKTQQKLKEYSKNLEKMVTERTKKLKDTQEELVRKEKLALLGQMAGSVSHELRNPLGVISNAIYYLKMVLPEANKEIKEYLEMISKEVKVSDKIISDLLDLSRTKVAEKEKVAISSLITDVLEKHPPSKKVKVTTNIPPSLPFIFVDSQQIKQVLINLITNSYQAMPEKGELRIKAKVNKGEVFIFITDTGSGISKENLKKLFEPLFTTKAKGVGLGLSIVRNLTEVNGGKIKAESKKGEGTTFTLVFPAKGEDGD